MPETPLPSLMLSQAWQIAALTLIVAAAVRLLAHDRPRIAHLLWLIVVVKCITPPLWSHPLAVFSRLGRHETAIVADRAHRPDWPTETYVTSHDDGSLDNINTSLSTSLVHTITNAPTETVNKSAIPWLFISIPLGVIVSGMMLAFVYARCLQRIRRHRVMEYDADIAALIAEVAQRLRLRITPDVIVSDVRFGPAVLGVFRPTIVLPKCLVEQTDTAAKIRLKPNACPMQRDIPHKDCLQLTPILAHELLHIRRGDLWVGTLQAFVRCLWWFHPAVWIANRMLSRETERCCDQQVVSEIGCTPLEYAHSLLAVIESKHRLKPVPIFPGMKPVEITSQRMERIMSLTQGRQMRMSWKSLAGVLLFAASVLPGAVIGHPPAPAHPNVAASPAPLISVTASNAEWTTFRVQGAVAKPDEYRWDKQASGPVRLLDAIAMAGGTAEHVDETVILQRQLPSGDEMVLLLNLKEAKHDKQKKRDHSTGRYTGHRSDRNAHDSGTGKAKPERHFEPARVVGIRRRPTQRSLPSHCQAIRN